MCIKGLGSKAGVSSGLRSWSTRFRVYKFRFRVQGLGLGFRFQVWVPGLGLGIGFSCSVQGLGFMFRVWGLNFWAGWVQAQGDYGIIWFPETLNPKSL